MNLEDMMFKDGWKQTRRRNAGKVYIEWLKEGFVINNENIWEEK